MSAPYPRSPPHLSRSRDSAAGRSAPGSDAHGLGRGACRPRLRHGGVAPATRSLRCVTRPGARRPPSTSRARGGSTPPTATSPAGSRTRRSRTRTGPRSRSPVTGAAPSRSPTATGRCSTGARSRATPLEPGNRRFLTFDGIFYDGDIWLDGGYVGATAGYFFPHTFEVTEQARRGPRRRAPPRGRGREPTAAGPHQEAHHHRRLLPLGQPRSGLEPGRDLAAGPAARHRPGPHQVAARAVPRGDRDPGPAAARRHPRLRHRTRSRCPSARGCSRPSPARTAARSRRRPRT